ncbi:MAG: hypothetical protein M3458_05485 [Acidobacteriota bacterium]|nr:hypothetical protein [Acidobacteriota bacterium]
MAQDRKSVAGALATVLCVVAVAVLFIIFNGGISIGASNHAGLVPVVRRILDPAYLPDDFGIELRLFHHRVFAYAVAGCSIIFGEDNALMLLSIIGMTLLSAALFYLCRTIGHSRVAFITVGLFIATNLAWAGLGLEENIFVGNRDIQPTTFAHALILFGVGCLIKKKYHLTTFLAGLIALIHIQVGLIFALLIVPFYIVALRNFSFGDIVRFAVLFFVPASFALSHLSHVMRSRGLFDSSLSLYYTDFRHPHHFELISVVAAVWVAAHLFAQAVAYWWLRRRERPESRAVGVLLVMSSTLAVLALVHFTDYYLLRAGTLIKIQFIRLSPLMTVFGTLGIATLVNVWDGERQRRQAGETQRLGFATAALVLAGILSALYWMTVPTPPRHFIGIKRYAEHTSAWVDVCRWIKEHGPRDTVYLTPPGNNGFTYLTDRSTVAEFKINPDGARYLTEWFERLRDLSGGTLPGGHGFQNNSLLNQSFASLSRDQLTALGEKYRAAYAVLPKSSPANLEVIYENKQFRVVKLPGVATAISVRGRLRAHKLRQI